MIEEACLCLYNVWWSGGILLHGTYKPNAKLAFCVYNCSEVSSLLWLYIVSVVLHSPYTECVAHDKCAKISFYNLLVRNSPCCLRKQSTTCRMKAFECWIVQESIKTSIRMAAAVWHSAVIQRNLAETLLLASGTFKEEASERLQVATDALDTVLGAVSEDIGFVSRASKLLGDAVEGELSSVIDVKAIQWEVEMSLFKRLEFDVSITAGFTGQTLKTCTGHVVLHEPTSHMKAILCCLFDSFCEDTQKKRFKKLKLKPLV